MIAFTTWESLPADKFTSHGLKWVRVENEYQSEHEQYGVIYCLGRHAIYLANDDYTEPNMLDEEHPFALNWELTGYSDIETPDEEVFKTLDELFTRAHADLCARVTKMVLSHAETASAIGLSVSIHPTTVVGGEASQ